MLEDQLDGRHILQHTFHKSNDILYKYAFLAKQY